VLESWIRLVLRWRGLVLVCWVVVAILGALAALGLPSLLTTSLTVPGTSSAQANAILVKDFHENIEGTFTVVVPLAGATAGPALGLIESALLDAVEAVPTASITQEHVVEGVLYANVDTTLDLGQAAKETPFLRHELSVQGVTGALVTGPPALQSDITPILANDLHRGEVLAVVLALALLVAVLGLCWALVIPYLVAAATTAGTLGVVFLLAHWVTMVLYVPNVIELIGLALAIDYSLLIVHRFRAEVAKPVQLEEAILRTMGSAGRTILISGCAVAIGLATLFIVPVPFVRSLGAAGLVVPVFSLLAAFTLQPVLLCYFAERGVSPVVLRGLMARRAPSDGTWARIGRGVTLRPARVLVLSLLVLAFVSSLAFGLELTPGSLTAIPQGMQSAKALNLVRDHVGPGAVTPIQVIIDTG